MTMYFIIKLSNVDLKKYSIKKNFIRIPEDCMHKKIYKSTITIFLVVVFLFSGIRSLEVEFVNFNFDPSSKIFLAYV